MPLTLHVALLFRQLDMGQETKIEWANSTINLAVGCYKKELKCRNCYAAAYANRWHGKRIVGIWHKGGPRLLVKSWQKKLHKIAKEAIVAGIPHTVFIQSLGDIAGESGTNRLVDANGNDMGRNFGQERAKLWEMVDDGKFRNIQWLFLTQEPSNISGIIPAHWAENPPCNVWWGFSAGCHSEFAIHGKAIAKHWSGNIFASFEPLYGPIDLGEIPELASRLGWVIAGGESGSKARLTQLEWATQMRDQCLAWRIPFLWKQWGRYQPVSSGVQHVKIAAQAGGIEYFIAGKKTANRLIQGKIHDEYPQFIKRESYE